MTIGRPKTFDREEVLDRAVDLFWRNGYEATGLSELTRRMGIGRQSLYDTFGDKHSLFVEAVRHYANQHTRPIVDTLEATGPPLENIRRALEGAVQFVSDGDGRGCLVTNTIVELAPRDLELTKIVRSTVARVEQAFHQALQRAVQAGQLSPKTDTLAVARFLNGTMQGLVVLGKASSGKAALQDVVRTALSVLS